MTSSLGGAARAWFQSEYKRIGRLADEAADAVNRAGGMTVDSPERREFIRLENKLARIRYDYSSLIIEG